MARPKEELPRRPTTREEFRKLYQGLTQAMPAVLTYSDGSVFAGKLYLNEEGAEVIFARPAAEGESLKQMVRPFGYHEVIAVNVFTHERGLSQANIFIDRDHWQNYEPPTQS